MEMHDPGDSRDEAVEFQFSVGEEVLARLAGAEVVRVESCSAKTRSGLPAWSIGTIVARRWSDKAFYLLSFQHDETVFTCWIEESAIEGTV